MRMSEITISEPIQDDRFYLRDDQNIHLDFLNIQRQLLTVLGCRRGGKTSFLYRAERLAKRHTRLEPIYHDFTRGSSGLIRELAKKTDASPDDMDAVIDRIDHCEQPLLVLIDEPMRCMWGADRDEASIKFLRCLAACIRGHQRHKMIIAETPLFFERCRDQERVGLTLLAEAHRHILRPVTNHVKEKVLADIDPVFTALGTQTGNLPIEINCLRLAAAENATRDPKEVERCLEFNLSYIYRLILGGLSPMEKALMTVAAHLNGNLREREIKQPAREILHQLNNVEGMGLVTSGADRLVRVASALFRAIIVDEPPTGQAESLVLKGVEKDPSPSHGPVPTFNKEFIIHQISDLHFGMFGRYQHGKTHWAANYLRHLKQLDTASRPHAIVICGDMASTGSPGELKAAQEFVNEIIKNGTLLKPLFHGSDPDPRRQLIIVPGNHDASWNSVKHESSLDGFAGFFSSLCHSPFAANGPVVYFPEVNISFLTINSTHMSGKSLQFFGEASGASDRLKQELDTIQKTVVKAYEEIMQNLQKHLENEKLDAISLKDRELYLRTYLRFTSGFVEEKNLRNLNGLFARAKEAAMGKAKTSPGAHKELRIAVCHHNLSNYYDPVLFSDLVNSGELRQALAEADISLLLHGHLHRSVVSSETNHAIPGKHRLYMLCGGCLGAISAEQTFHEIRIASGKIESPGKDTRNVQVSTYVCLDPDMRDSRYQLVGHPIELEV